jgi:thiamine-phosphate pyrophosphorylase
MADTQTQIYLISPLDVSGAFPDRLARALDAAEIAAFQFRVKDMSEHDAARLAEPLQRICADRDTAFIVNDSIALAKRLGADGVHLGQDDGSVADARARLGREAQIGVTCHASRHLAMEAGEAGADYVAFGAFYPSATKKTLHAAEPELLRWWSMLFELPCVAIGGITAQNCAPLVQAGADFLAVSHAVWGGDEAAGIEALAAAITAALEGRQ